MHVQVDTSFHIQVMNALSLLSRAVFHWLIVGNYMCSGDLWTKEVSLAYTSCAAWNSILNVVLIRYCGSCGVLTALLAYTHTCMMYSTFLLVMREKLSSCAAATSRVVVMFGHVNGVHQPDDT